VTGKAFRRLWLTVALVATLLPVAYAIGQATGRQGELGVDVSKPLQIDVACQPTADTTCGGPTMGTAAPGPGAEDLVVWSRFPEQQSIDGVWARRIDARSGQPIGAQVQVAQFPDVGSVLAAYNPRSHRYLILWQGLPNNGAMAGEINGQVLAGDLTAVGPPIAITAHDFYLYPGDLTANPANGDFLLMQLSESHEPAAPHAVNLTRIASDGTVDGTASWPVGPQAGEGQVHATYDLQSRSYIVAWLVTGGGSVTFEARAASADLNQLGPIETIDPGDATLGSDFSIAEVPGTSTAVVAWLNNAPTGGPTIVAQQLESSGQPLGTMSTISTLEDPPPLPAGGLGRLQVTAVGDHDVASWQGLDKSETVAIPRGLTGAATNNVVDLPGLRNTYSHAMVANASANTLVVLSTSDGRAANQIYARPVPLPR
jgi:hypothetical protein